MYSGKSQKIKSAYFLQSKKSAGQSKTIAPAAPANGDDENSEKDDYDAERQPEQTIDVSQSMGTVYTPESAFRDNRSTIQGEIAWFRSNCKKTHFELRQLLGEGAMIPEMTALKLQMQIHSQRIEDIVNRLIRKLQAVAYIPYYLKNDGEILKKFMPPDQANFILQRLSTNKDSYDNSDITIFRQTDGIDVDLNQIILYLATNKCLETLHQRKKMRIGDKIHTLIGLLKKLLDISLDKVRVTAEDQCTRDWKLRVAMTNFRERFANIEKLEMKLHLKTQETEVKLREKDILIRDLKNKLKKVRTQHRLHIEDIVRQSGVQMCKEDEMSYERRQILAEAARASQTAYQTLIEDHLEYEKTLRAKRFKIESQLATWIGKYDQESSYRQEQLDVLQEGHETERLELLELECQFKEQEKVFTQYKAEKDKEDHLNFSKSLYALRSNRAAKIIQRAWRAYRARKMARKKARKDKAKAKAAKKAVKK